MTKRVDVDFNGKVVKVNPGTTILKLQELFPELKRSNALGAIVNNRLMGLERPLRSSSIVETVDYSSKEGADIYRRTLALIFCEAFAELYPEVRLEIGQALGRGYFYRIHSGENCAGKRMLRAVEQRMRELIAADRPIHSVPVAAEEAEEYFLEKGYTSKARLLRQRLSAEVDWVVMGEFRDVVYGPIAPRTGLCADFGLFPKSTGCILVFPTQSGKIFSRLPEQRKLFAAYRETRAWNEMIGIWNVSQLNQACISGSISENIRISEGLQEKKIARLADRISHAATETRLVLIAGPSSSGKTTFTKRLDVQLRVNGIRPLLISLDNYYVNRLDTPKNADGTYDFECLEALDVAMFNDHMQRLLNGESVETPIYDFVQGIRRRDKTIPLKLETDQVLVVEGIHGLNPKLSASVPARNKFKIYVSALTQLCIDDHNRIFTSDIRLMRRTVRDRLYRGYSAAQTIAQWPHVRQGENKYIFPFQEEADTMFDTSLVYEPAILRPYLQRFLMEVNQNDPAYVDVYRLFKFLLLFIPILPNEIPPTSILREFIGGSSFEY